MSKRTVVEYTDHARKDLRALERVDARRIVLKVQTLSSDADPCTRAKALSGVLQGLYRYRVGEYRVIFERRDRGIITILTILRIRHRKDIYGSNL